MDLNEFIGKKLFYALVGASNNKEKFGNKVFLDLHNAGYDIVPINPKDTKIEGELAYPTIGEVPRNIDVVIFVVPSDQTEKVLKEVHELAIPKVWFQPGSESDKAVKYCIDKNIRFVSGKCIMAEKKS
ncbi:CoA-binding protein [Candidatus Woesearchaeota archaeon]|nr:CoA-binding protein [Candidatus Woesearchaeota archaeon]